MPPSPDLYLASRSPRRRELLIQIGVEYQTLLPDVFEQQRPGESPQEYVCRLAMEKAQAGWLMLAVSEQRPVLGADTVVVLDGDVLEKPQHRDDGMAMMAKLSGRTHQVMTGMALVMGADEQSRLSVSHVTFRETSEEERARYWESGEPLDKAGGYAVQGLAAAFITRIEGSYSGIMGLSLFEVTEMLAQQHIHILENNNHPSVGK